MGNFSQFLVFCLIFQTFFPLFAAEVGSRSYKDFKNSKKSWFWAKFWVKMLILRWITGKIKILNFLSSDKSSKCPQGVWNHEKSAKFGFSGWQILWKKWKNRHLGILGTLGFSLFPIWSPLFTVGCMGAKNGNSDFLTQTKLMETVLNVQKQHFM